MTGLVNSAPFVAEGVEYLQTMTVVSLTSLVDSFMSFNKLYCAAFADVAPVPPFVIGTVGSLSEDKVPLETLEAFNDVNEAPEPENVVAYNVPVDGFTYKPEALYSCPFAVVVISAAVECEPVPNINALNDDVVDTD